MELLHNILLCRIQTTSISLQINSLAVYLFSSDSSSGANQIALLLAACIAMIIGYKNGYSWSQMERGIVKSIGSSWTVAGTLDEAEFSPEEVTP